MASSLADGMEPRLPIDLEREIFELAAVSQPRSIPILILVARRIKAWLEPLIYRVLSITNLDRIEEGTMRITKRACLKMLDAKPAPFFHGHVRHVSLTNPEATLEESVHILSKFTGAVGLALFQIALTPIFLPPITAMPLERFAVDLELLFGKSGVDFGHTLFSRLTHLDMFDSTPLDAWAVAFGQLPHLTHLSVWPGKPAFFRGVLQHCAQLEVLALVFTDQYGLQEGLEEYRFFGDDPRSVLMSVDDFLNDWEVGARGGEDFWVRAERFIEKRRAGEIKASDYVIYPAAGVATRVCDASDSEDSDENLSDADSLPAVSQEPSDDHLADD
ncbi:hypothetical protein FB451DRAFT_1207059 [Mycena latifolia]|nr:hypothetical protein FB451DRAFT_1207059 [Mycena latifolia]